MGFSRPSPPSNTNPTHKYAPSSAPVLFLLLDLDLGRRPRTVGSANLLGPNGSRGSCLHGHGCRRSLGPRAAAASVRGREIKNVRQRRQTAGAESVIRRRQPMEIALAASGALRKVAVDVIRKRLGPEVEEEIWYMTTDLELIIKDLQRNNHGTIQEVWIRDLQNFSYDLEDCIHRFTMVAIHEHQGSTFHRPFRTTKNMLSRYKFAGEIKHLRQQLQEKMDYTKRICYVDPPQTAAPGSSSVPTASYISQGDPLGLFEKYKEKIGNWVRKEKEQHLNQLMVISIVGFLGMGKTTLAKIIYDDEDTYKGYLRIFVVASEFRDKMELLMKIYQEVFKVHSPLDQDYKQLIQNIKGKLRTEKRYVMVIDDLQTLETWHNIETAFPMEDTSGLIIVTTRINSVATVCCFRGCYVYRMEALDEQQSENLLKNGVSDISGDFDTISKSIVSKCDGLPLALVGVAEYLEGSRGDSLLAMKEALTDWYNRLTSTHKTMLLSLSMYPVGHTIRKRSLFRRLCSEGPVSGHTQRYEEDVADKHFMELVDWNLIQPVDIRYNGEVKTCRIHGVLHDFIVQKSVDENFGTLIHNDKLLWNGSGSTVRRLFVYKTSNRSVRTAMDIDLSFLRTLAILKHEGGPIVDFRKCILLQVLDLENCPWLNNKVLRLICTIFCLKYLSLRGTAVTEIPKRISKLQYLEILVIRKEEKEEVLLPMEILILPQLTCLHGRFRLHYDRTFVSKNVNLLRKCRLETLAGIVVDKNSGIEHILSAMSKLRKIKLWSDNTSGLLNIFPSLDHIEELYLSSSSLSGEELSTLQNLPCLMSLKLVDDKDCSSFCEGPFEIKRGKFRRLQHLWIEAKKLPQMSMEDRSLSHLTSLNLLCNDVSGFPADAIARLPKLSEVTLSDEVNPETKEKWEEEARVHINRPTIKTSAARRSAVKQQES